MSHLSRVVGFVITIFLMLLTGCALIGTGPEDSRFFVARFDMTSLVRDRDFPDDPHAIPGVAIVDSSRVSYPAILGAGFDARPDLNTILISQEHQKTPYIYALPQRGRSFRRNRVSVILREFGNMYGAGVTHTGSVISVGKTYQEAIGRSVFLVFGSTNSGRPLTAFGDDGRIETAFVLGSTPSDEFRSDSAATHVVSHVSGAFYVVGVVRASPESGFAIARYTESGILDRRFGGDGRVVTSPASLSELRTDSVAVAPGGGLLFAGSATYSDGTDRIVIGRLSLDGSMDDTFGSGGWIVLDPEPEHQKVVAMAIIPGSTLALMSTGELRAYRNSGLLSGSFGDAEAGLGTRTGSTSVRGTAKDLLIADFAIYVLHSTGSADGFTCAERSTCTYITRMSNDGIHTAEQLVGPGMLAFRDTYFGGERLATDGDHVYVVGLMQ